MHLSAQQQRYVEAAMIVVPKAIAAFRSRYPTLRVWTLRIDTLSVAHLAICKAARTYDPARSQVTTYFSTAVRNALLKEIDRERRVQGRMIRGLSGDVAQPQIEEPDAKLAVTLQAAMKHLPVGSRRLLELRFTRGLSLRELAEQSGRDPRTIRRRIDSALAALETLLRSPPAGPATRG